MPATVPMPRLRPNLKAPFRAEGNRAKHAYGALHRLIDTQRGTLNGTQHAVTALAFRQKRDLDGLGNWAAFSQDDDGSGWNLEKTRTHSAADEFTGVSATTGSAWHGPQHDAASNMIALPQPHDPGEGFEAEYDAWNRLVKLVDATTSSTVAAYQWDGGGRRIVKASYASGVLDETRHFYYSQDHQIMEERVGGTGSSDVQLQYVWGLRYVDELVLRDRDSTGDGTLDQRHYALQNANYNVMAIVDTVGSVAERYTYSPYGERTVLNDNFSVHTDPIAGSFAFAIGHQGKMHDEVTGLMYYNARMYYPRLGQFIQRDPFMYDELLPMAGDGYQDGMNLYAYYPGLRGRGFDPTGMDWLDCFNECLEDNEPLGLAVEAFIANIAAGPVRKSTVARLADMLGDRNLAGKIRASMRRPGASPFTTWPSTLSAKLRIGGRSSLRAIGVASAHLLTAYGLALAAVEVHCAGYCTGCWWYGIDYDPSPGNILDSLKEKYFQ